MMTEVDKGGMCKVLHQTTPPLVHRQQIAGKFLAIASRQPALRMDQVTYLLYLLKGPRDKYLHIQGRTIWIKVSTSSHNSFAGIIFQLKGN